MTSRVGAGLAALLLVGTAPPRASAQGTAQGTAGPAGGVVHEPNVDASLAAEAAAAAVAACAERGWRVTATVVDRAGQVKAVLRGDGAGPHTVASSLAKAYTSSSLRTSTSAVLDTVQRTPGAQYLPMIEGFLIVGGGVPIRAGDGPGAEVAGAIGVGGAPGGQFDEQCAEAGIARIRDRLR